MAECCKKALRLRFLAGILFLAVTLLHGAIAGVAAPQESAPWGSTYWPSHLLVLTGANGGQSYSIGQAMADALSRDVLPTTSRVGGGLTNIEEINRNAAGMGFTLASFVGAALSGESAYKHINMDNVTVMANLYPQVLYVLVRKEFAQKFNIESMDDLVAQQHRVRFASLKYGTASHFVVDMLLQYGYNTSYEALKKQEWELSFNDYAEILDDFVEGDIDAFAFTAGPNMQLIHSLEEYMLPKILPISQQVVEKLGRKFHVQPHVIEPGTYRSVTTPTMTLGDSTLLVIRKDFPDDFVRALVKALWANREAIAHAVRDFGFLTPKTAVFPGLPMHPAALQTWNELQATPRNVH